MARVAFQEPETEQEFDQTAFNLKRWEEVLGDSFLESLSYRIETNRFGEIIMSPLPGTKHSRRARRIVDLLENLMEGGEAFHECAISTSDGVKGSDAIWISDERHAPMAEDVCFTIAPEICVEVLSPRNTRGEIEHKKALYFEAGAREVWVCAKDGKMAFFVGSPKEERNKSVICPEFPDRVELREING